MIIHINVATATDHTLFTPQTGKRFRVVGYHLVSAGSVAVTWKSGTTAFGGAQSMVVGVPHTLLPNGMDRVGLMEGGDGEALKLGLGGAVQVSGWVDVDHL